MADWGGGEEIMKGRRGGIIPRGEGGGTPSKHLCTTFRLTVLVQWVPVGGDHFLGKGGKG